MRRPTDHGGKLGALGTWANATTITELLARIDAESRCRTPEPGIALELVLDHGHGVRGRWLAQRNGLVWLTLDDQRLCAVDAGALRQIIVAAAQLPGPDSAAALSETELQARLRVGLDGGRLRLDWQGQQSPASAAERLALAALIEALERLWPRIAGDPLGREASACLQGLHLHVGAQLAVSKDRATLAITVPRDAGCWPTDIQLQAAIESQL